MEPEYDPNLKPPAAGDLPNVFAVACGLIEEAPIALLRAELRPFGMTIKDASHKNIPVWEKYKWCLCMHFGKPMHEHVMICGTLRECCRHALKHLKIGEEVTHDG